MSENIIKLGPRKLQKLSQALYVSIPRLLIDQLSLKKSDELFVYFDVAQKKIILEKAGECE